MSNITIELMIECDNDTGMVTVTRKIQGMANPIAVMRMIISGTKALNELADKVDPAQKVSMITGDMKHGTKDETTAN